MNILAIDLSLRGCGIIVLPTNWGGHWHNIHHQTIGEKLGNDATPQQKLGRLVRISSEILAIAEMFRPDHAVVEHYSFNARGHHMDLGELGGVVKHQLATKLGLVAQPVVASAARKVIMGSVPRKGAKDATLAYLRKIGMPLEWTDDEADAFVVANYASSALGGFAFAMTPVDAKKVKRRAA